MANNIKKTQSFGEHYFDVREFPNNYNLFFWKSLIFWLIMNLGSIIIFSFVYYFYDNQYISKFEGLNNGKRNRKYYEYLYFSSMVGTFIGFSDVIAKRDILTKFIIIGQVIFTLFLNYAFLTFKELKLADDPTGTFDFTKQ